MPSSNGTFGRSLSVRRRNNCSSLRDPKIENQDWLAAQAARQSVAIVVDKTGMTERAVHNIRARKSKISFDNLVEWCRNDDEFRLAFFEHCGGKLETNPGTAAALTKAINAVLQAQAARGT